MVTPLRKLVLWCEVMAIVVLCLLCLAQAKNHMITGRGQVRVQKKRTLSSSYKTKYYAITNSWKEAKKSRSIASVMGHLVSRSFQEIMSCPPVFQHLAKQRASAYLEKYFLQEELAKSHGKAPSGHEAEFQYRVRAALDHELAAKREAFRGLDYKMSFLLAGVKKEPGTEEAPSWSPCRLRQLRMSLGPRIRTVYFAA